MDHCVEIHRNIIHWLKQNWTAKNDALFVREFWRSVSWGGAKWWCRTGNIWKGGRWWDHRKNLKLGQLVIPLISSSVFGTILQKSLHGKSANGKLVLWAGGLGFQLKVTSLPFHEKMPGFQKHQQPKPPMNHSLRKKTLPQKKTKGCMTRRSWYLNTSSRHKYRDPLAFFN